MNSENELKQNQDGQKKPELNLREEVRKFLRVKNRVEAKKQEARRAKKGEEVESPKVETEQKSVLN